MEPQVQIANEGSVNETLASHRLQPVSQTTRSQSQAFLLLLSLLVLPSLAPLALLHGWFLLVTLGFLVYDPDGWRQFRSGIKMLWPFFAMMLLGTVFVWQHRPWDMLRDYRNFLLPAWSLLPGWLLARHVDRDAVIRALKMAGLIIATIFLLRLALRFGELYRMDVYTYRKSIPAIDSVVVWAFLCLLVPFFGPKPRPRSMPILFRALPLALLYGSVMWLTFSRTYPLILATGLLFVIIPSLIQRPKTYLAMALAISVLGVAALSQVDLDTMDVGSNQRRWAGSIQELNSTEFESVQDISENYRSYESIMALNTFLEGSIPEMLAGGGCGQLVDLQWSLPVPDDSVGEGSVLLMDKIPILHNGYLMVLVKAGLAGVALFMTFFWSVWRGLSAKKEVLGPLAPLGRVALLGLAVTTYVFSGPFHSNQLFATMALLGILLNLGAPSSSRLEA